MNACGSLLRVFYRFSADVVLYTEQGRVRGVIARADIEEQLSDLSGTREQIPVRYLNDLSQAQNIVRKYGFLQEGRTVLPVVNAAYDFVGLWHEDLLTGAWQGRSEPRPWNPPVVERESSAPAEDESATEPAREDEAAEPEETEPLEVQLREHQPSIARLPAAENHTVRPDRESVPDTAISHLRTEIENGRFAIAALEAVNIPMMAMDLQGNTVFINEEWKELARGFYSRLQPDNLLNKARDRIAELALTGNLDAEAEFQLPRLITGYSLSFRTLRFSATPLGYVFYAVRQERPVISTLPDERRNVRYAGRTLPDILDEEELKVLEWALSETDGNQSHAAMLLGIPRQTFSYKYNKLSKGKRGSRNREQESAS